MVVDTMGNLLSMVVHAANIHDTKSGIIPAILAYLTYPTILKFSADGGYCGTFVNQMMSLLSLDVEISKKIKAEGFNVIPKRWVVERTLAWFNFSRRLSKDYEITTTSSETMAKISHFHTLLNRL